MENPITTDHADIVWVSLNTDQVNDLVNRQAVRLDINADLIKGTPQTIIMLRRQAGDHDE